MCTIMIGRLDDWLKIVAKKENIVITPGHLDWAGIAAIKKAYGLFRQRGIAPGFWPPRTAITCTGRN